MTKRELIESLAKLPDAAPVVVQLYVPGTDAVVVRDVDAVIVMGDARLCVGVSSLPTATPAPRR